MNRYYQSQAAGSDPQQAALCRTWVEQVHGLNKFVALGNRHTPKLCSLILKIFRRWDLGFVCLGLEATLYKPSLSAV